MFVDKDKKGEISIQSMNAEDAAILVDCICAYFGTKNIECRTDSERRIVFLKSQLEKQI